MTCIQQIFTKVSSIPTNSSMPSSSYNKRRNLLLPFLASLLLVFALIFLVVIVAEINSHHERNNDVTVTQNSRSHVVLRSACSNTQYPDLCLSDVSNVTQNLTSQKDVIELSINLTTRALRRNLFTIKEIGSWKNLTKRGKTAIHDCLDMVDDTLDELRKVVENLHEYPNKKPLTQHADNLKTLVSAAMTNQETCLDGFSHNAADKVVREALLKGQVSVERRCSNVLAMIKNMTDTDIAEYKLKSRKKLKEEEAADNDGGWPAWLSAGDRKLLQTSSTRPDIVVAADGSGNYRTVQAAVEAAPSGSSRRYIIRIKAGVYRENVEVPKNKKNIMLIGDGRKITIITGNKNVVDGSTTLSSATVGVHGEGFLARDLTIQNAAGPSKQQAVALLVGGDLSAFYRCNILAYQDTLFVHSNRQFFVNCLIAGTVDFIFGNSAVVLQNCNIRVRKPSPKQKNMITAQGRTDKNQNTGIVIQNCRISADSDLQPVKSRYPTYLGRPWKEYSRTVVMKSTIGDVVHPAGWFEWSGNFALDTLYYGEYRNTGAGAESSRRVKWKGFRVIESSSEVQGFSLDKFIGGGNWLRSTGFPFSHGL